MKKEKIIVSSCLMGVNCRWHGKKVYKSSFVKRYIKEKEEEGVEIIFVEVCPELLGGLGVPRKPIKRRGERAWFTCKEKSKRKEVTGKEVTVELKKGAKKVLNKAKRMKIKKAILCQWSPSCDIRGFAGKLLAENGIEVINTF